MLTNSTKISLKPIEPKDLTFLKEVYKSTREHEMRSTGWPQEQINHFIEFQFNAQHAHYTSTYKDACFNIIFLKNTKIGRLYTWETNTQIKLIDITLLPQYRGKRIGTQILNDLIAKSKINGKILNLHVERHNIAKKLYERLGFKHVEDKGTHLYMEYNPK